MREAVRSLCRLPAMWDDIHPVPVTATLLKPWNPAKLKNLFKNHKMKPSMLRRCWEVEQHSTRTQIANDTDDVPLT